MLFRSDEDRFAVVCRIGINAQNAGILDVDLSCEPIPKVDENTGPLLRFIKIAGAIDLIGVELRIGLNRHPVISQAQNRLKLIWKGDVAICGRKVHIDDQALPLTAVEKAFTDLVQGRDVKIREIRLKGSLNVRNGKSCIHGD